MSLVYRWLLRLFTAALVLGLLAVLFVYYLASRSLPEYQTRHEVAGITAPVEIIRDNANVPHITGATDEDVYFGLGFAHAQDRLWQMALLRRTAQGRLSEIFGPRTIKIDTLARRLDLYRLAQQSVAVQSAETMTALQAYSAGVNARLLEINEEALGRGAPERFLFNMPVAPWQPSDSIAVMKLMALQLSGHLQDEVLRARTSLLLDDAQRLSDILPDIPGPGTAALPEYALYQDIFPDAPRFAESTYTPSPFLNPVPAPALSGASNAWAASAERSASRGTLLANDPHLGLTAPSIWYLARLELQVALPALFASFPQLSLAEPPRYAMSYHFHKLDRLMVRP